MAIPGHLQALLGLWLSTHGRLALDECSLRGYLQALGGLWLIPLGSVALWSVAFLATFRPIRSVAPSRVVGPLLVLSSTRGALSPECSLVWLPSGPLVACGSVPWLGSLWGSVCAGAWPVLALFCGLAFLAFSLLSCFFGAQGPPVQTWG